MKHMKTMKKKLQYLHALHGENKKHQLLKNFVFPILEHDALTGKYSANGIFFYHEAHEDNEEKTSISSCASW